MAADGKKIDPRFDPAFQRGYPNGPQAGQSDAVRASRTVDALRGDAAESQYSRTPSQPPSTAQAAQEAQAGQPTASPTSSRSTTAVAPEGNPAPFGDEQLAPQSHYVDDAGALAEIAPAPTRKSLARNPWIYVLWLVGVIGVAVGAGVQVWTYAVYYRSNGPVLTGFDWIQGLQAASPAMSQVGAICIGFALLVHALNWMRNNQ
ncbi:hypothetical protein [Salinibacterium sp. M195]|uniref:hypothetical protein n=1 Tax=Salinibacterium sp. M195 TaxID=2583374 RepID=UPI001C632D73|nr:hypothetical protein [Salinibacterium sp. M195]QYH35254.1 hypothetical protein FFT87_04420 [Salinibacterium sp. M195]